MEIREYHRIVLLASALILAGGPAAGRTKQEAIAGSVLRRVEAISAKVKTLDSLGKSTLEESAQIMDLDRDSERPLVKALRGSKDWKVRYWAADMLAYVGRDAAGGELIKK